jgi:hypothetical protein
MNRRLGVTAGSPCLMALASIARAMPLPVHEPSWRWS